MLSIGSTYIIPACCIRDNDNDDTKLSFKSKTKNINKMENVSMIVESEVVAHLQANFCPVSLLPFLLGILGILFIHSQSVANDNIYNEVTEPPNHSHSLRISFAKE